MLNAIQRQKLFNLFQKPEFLTVDKRKIMNSLVDEMNKKLAEAVKRAGDGVVFVDYDKYIGEFEGRFCEKFIDESQDVAASRYGHRTLPSQYLCFRYPTLTTTNHRVKLMFYELNTVDDQSGDQPWKRSTTDSVNGTFNAHIDIFGQITMMMDKDAKYTLGKANDPPAEAPVAQAAAVANVEIGGQEISLPTIPGLLPDGYVLC
jgi:hypothetical protein